MVLIHSRPASVGNFDCNPVLEISFSDVRANFDKSAVRGATSSYLSIIKNKLNLRISPIQINLKAKICSIYFDIN